MAKINMGILDGFIGKVGTVVGFKHFGKSIMRAYQKAVKNPRTAEQRLVRAKFGLLGRMGTALLPAIDEGLAPAAARKQLTPLNAFVQYNWRNTRGDDAESVSVDFTGVALSLGSLQLPGFGTPDFGEELTVKVGYAPNSDVPGTDDDDAVYIAVYQPDSGQAVTSKAAKRSEGTVSVKVPSTWSGLSVHTYGFAVGVGGRNSGTAYLGLGTIS